jgi:hypothetical protein
VEHRKGAAVYLELAVIELARWQYWRASGEKFHQPGGAIGLGARGETERREGAIYRHRGESIKAGVRANLKPIDRGVFGFVRRDFRSEEEEGRADRWGLPVSEEKE